MSVANTITYETLYEDILQDRLDHPTTWKEMCDVTYSDTKLISTSYMSTTPSVQTVTRGTGHSMQTFSETAETLDITNGRDLGLFVDWADLAQSDWTKPAELFDRIGALLNEYIESAVLARHSQWTNFGTLDIGGGGSSSSQITVSATNIDDIIRGVKRKIRVANGQSFMNRNGVGFVWRAADFEILEAKPCIGLVKSLLINGENLRHKAKATLSKQIKKFIVQLQRLSEGTLTMSEAIVRSA